ncbi:hypothetical protein P7D22_06905 [Lichenihabitans sp. Uapishka_5]|uniref:hypothetical protein n=1 Tax=Lichenihabitans sp. Uapishka_5 TaxID=3037302 RepID=UPI0029E7E2C2|nr:hypothetical protein [Lichenihabitans sp. Uapishka_5]MDX7950906.1 hypothetical protein [Lichenihabitans sp. Uapishka_5]
MKALRFVLLGLAVALVASLGWRMARWAPTATVPAVAFRPVDAPPRPDAAAAKALVLSRMGDAPDYAPFYDRLRTEFPTQYAGVLDRASQTVMRTGRPPNPERLLTDALRDLRQSRGVLAAKAEPLPLGEVFAAQGAMLDTLAERDPSLCADFLYGGSGPGFMAFAATHRGALARIAMATLNAIADGQRKPVERQQPTNADFDQLTAALKAQNLTDEQIAALLDGKTFDPPLPDQQICDGGRTYLHVLSDMPDDLRLRIYGLSAQLLARS